MKVIFSFLFLLISIMLQAQIPVGSWRIHLPGNNARHVAYSPSKVYCTTGESLFAYNLKDNSIEKFSKITGLTDFGITAIAFSEEADLLVIGYENGNIDILKGNNIINISDLKKKTLPASKAIHHIYFNGNKAYLSCGFGILLLDIEKLEVKDTYVFGPAGTFIQVNSTTILDNQIYAATESGIYRADASDPMLVDYSKWIHLNNIPNSEKSFSQVASNESKLYAVYSNTVGGDSLYYFDNSWHPFILDESTEIYNVSFSEDYIVVSTSINLKFFDKNRNLKNTLWQYPEIGSAQPRETFIDKIGNLWIADFQNGLVEQKVNGKFVQVMPNGPLSSKIKSFLFANNNLYTTAGGTSSGYNNLFNQGEYSVFSDDEWTSYQMAGVFDFMNIKPDPKDKDLLYISSWGSGLFTFKNGEIVDHFDETNSSLQNAIPGGPYTRVWGIDFDQQGNLWAANSNVTNTLSVRKPTGEWIGYPLKNYINAEVAGDLLVDDYNNIWVVLLKGAGIMVLNTNNTPDNRDDDVLIQFKPKNAYGQTINNVYTLVKDLEGNIWVGTDFGPIIYANTNEVFEGKTDGKQPTLPRPGSDLVDPLLGSETIRSIAVDGANRKWIGTENGGAFLVSAEGDSSLLQFNTDNSPILSNTIIGIGIHDKTGEVFFGTSQGIISYRSTATKADDDFGDVYAFPNPVRPNYEGLITITGLIKDANVKITDIAGNLVYETTTLGGQVVWDGKNHDGRRVASGIYMIFCTNTDGSKTRVTKLLFLN